MPSTIDDNISKPGSNDLFELLIPKLAKGTTMAYANVLDDEFTAVRPNLKPGMSPRITAGFNATLLAYEAIRGFLAFIASDRARGFRFSGLLLSSLIDLARVAVIVFIAAWFLRAFWQRLVTSLVPVRPIDFQEALAIILMMGLLFGH